MTTSPGDVEGRTAPFDSPLCSAWAGYGDIPNRRLADLAIGDTDEWDRLLWRASERLYWATGAQYRGAGGSRTVHLHVDEARPVSLSPQPRASWGETVNGIALDCRSVLARNPREPHTFYLPDPDVTAVDSVAVEGDVQASSSYRLETDGALTRIGPRGWPLRDGAVEVTYRYGRPPNSGGVAAAADLAVEYARQLSGLATDLPDRVLTITREGITWTYADPADALKDRLTGIPRVDDWVRTVNPYLRTGAAEVVSPDVYRAR
jgi:hypothetical protein